MNPLNKLRKFTTHFFAATYSRTGLFLPFFMIAAAYLLALSIELIQRGSIPEVLAWSSTYIHSFHMNVIICFFILLLIYCLIGSLFVSISMTTLLLLTISLVSYYKTKLIGEPLSPWDILLNKEAANIVPLVAGTSAMYHLGMVAAAALAILGLRLVMPRFALPFFFRAIFGLLACFMLFSLSYKPDWSGNLYVKLNIPDINWNQSQNYEVNGVMLGFAMNVKNTIIPKPPGYTQFRMEQIASRVSGVSNGSLISAAATAAEASGVNPNVIFVMSESFWDPTLLPGVTFSEDPLPTFHALQQTTTSGYMLTPQYGGGTSNVEFEVLTGSSISFLPSGSMAYQQYINRPTPSLASYFGDQGYKSMAIHSYEGWFWNRTNVYKHFGFQSFMSQEFFLNPEYKGGFIADDEVSRTVIRQVEQAAQPMFIYAVTMQNHSPYEWSRYSDYPIQIEGDLTPSAREALETYTRGAQDADQSLKLLVDYFSTSEEPTMIVFFGDHLPGLGYDYEVYRQGGFIDSAKSAAWSLEEMQRMHSVPLIIWSNFPQEQQELPIISSSFLGSYVMDLLQMNKPALFALDYELYQQTPGLIRGLVVDANKELHATATTTPESVQEDIEQYRELQYDMLFGNQFVQQLTDHSFLAKYPLSDYNSEFTDVHISEAELYETESKALSLTVRGKNFYDGVYLVVNGRKLSPSMIEADLLEIDIPTDLVSDGASLSVQVKQINTKNIILSQSNIMEVSITKPPDL